MFRLTSIAAEYLSSSVLTNTAGLLISLFVCYVTYFTAYHPLSKYPGPFVAKFTNAYGGYIGYRKILHTQTLLNTQKYGNVFRQGPNKLIFNTAAAVSDILLNPRVVKGSSYDYTRLTTKTHNIVNCTDKQMHKRKRRIIGPVLSESSMNKFQPNMDHRVNQFLLALLASSKANTPANMSDLCTRLAFDVVGDLSYGFSFNTLTDEAYRFLPKALSELSWRVSNVMQQPVLRYFHLAAISIRPAKMMEMKKAVMNFVGTRKSQDKHAVHDFYSVVTGELGENDEFFRGEMWSESMSFLTAGGQTIPAAMSALFFYLSKYPACYTKLAEEIRATFASAGDIRAGSKLSGCKYLKACIDEAMRCNSPLTNIMWRVQDPADDSGKPLIVDGHVIPSGVEIGINLWSLFHNENIFPDPYLFDPERWLEKDGESEESKAHRQTMRKAFVAFSAGERVCAGRAMAWREMNLTIAKTLWFFDFGTAPGMDGEVGASLHQTDNGVSLPEFKVADAFTAEHDGPCLNFTPRKEFVDELEKC